MEGKVTGAVHERQGPEGVRSGELIKQRTWTARRRDCIFPNRPELQEGETRSAHRPDGGNPGGAVLQFVQKQTVEASS